ncbi:beta-L-arabinofuranosidase domain-containing protein [Streptomyces sp. NPDC051896]|uniref:beta-L-arabinofuranosidase domain-containing protein n=1 Tax=Streptomyces sp. NPDC051896 TaxID=3155416 RepID=UPI003449745C
MNARTSIPDGFARLEQAGNLHDLRLAAGTTTGAYTNDLPFMDSDVYKWLEAVAWAESEGADERLESQVDQLTALLADAQEPSGYLQSYFQVVRPDDRFVDLRWGHELYCAGHLNPGRRGTRPHHRPHRPARHRPQGRRPRRRDLRPRPQRRRVRAPGDRDGPGGAVPPHR